MALSNVVCIIVAMVSTYWAAHRQHILSSHAMRKDLPDDHPFATKVNLSIDVKMSVDDEEKHEVHKLLFSVPTYLLYDSVLTVLTPVQAKKLENDIRSATDSMSQKVLDVTTDEPSNEPYVPTREEEVVTHSTRPNQSRATTEKKASNQISRNDKKGQKAISMGKNKSQPSSLQISHSTTSDGQIMSTKFVTRETKELSAARKKTHLKLKRHSVTSASSATHTKSKTLSSTFREPLGSRHLSLPTLETTSEPTQSPTVVCQELNIEIKTDVYGSETTWELKNDATNKVILKGGPYETGVVTVNNYAACLYPGYYTFIIFDLHDDGLSDGGYYMLKLNGVMLHTGKSYGNRDVVPIKVTLPSEAISNKPSVSSKPTAATSQIQIPSLSNHPTSKPSLSLQPTRTSLPTQYCTGEGQIKGQVRISGSDMTEALSWDIFESKSDEALFEGGFGVTDICVSEYGCYTFRIREGNRDGIFEYELLLRGILQLQQNDTNINHHARFGLRSCCRTSCCATNQAHLTMFIHSSGPTEDLSWKLYQSQNNTMSTEPLVMEGGQYDGNQDLYETEICVDPMVCHKLEILGSNHTSSYESVMIKIDGEIKTREYSVQTGSSIEFCSVCSTKPLLVTDYGSNYFSDETEMATFDMRLSAILQKLGQISSQEKLIDTNTFQYKAACWIIFDDLLQLQSNDPMLVQRYVLAALYHATGGENWRLHEYKIKYLSNDSECDWNRFENGYFYGVECDEDRHIRSIYLDDMNLTSELPSEISSLKYLEHLNLDGNYLEGKIPIELGRLKTLKVLSIKNNYLSGTIPDSIFDLSELVFLDIRYNSLKGTISTLVGKLYQLEHLVLHDLSLTGSIPEELFGIMSLVEIDIRNNELTGTIPLSIGQPERLRWFNAGYNRLTGSIPSEMGLLENLESVYLSGNQLQGSIPEEITHLKKVKTFLLFENLLEGTIPANIGNMTDLVHVYISDNNLHGTIPSSFSELHNLQILDLHGNKLEGAMPGEICKLRDVALSTLVADCGYVNEYSIPEVECNCCTVCVGRFSNIEQEVTCRDSELRIEMSYEDDNWISMKWAVLNGANKAVLADSYEYDNEKPTKTSYRACMAISDCFTFSIDGRRYYDERTSYFDGVPAEYRDTHPHLSFSIYINEIKIYDNDDDENQMWHGKVNFGYSYALGFSSLDQCDDVQFFGETYAVGSHENLLLNQIATISGYSTLLNKSSAKSQAAKWILYDDKYTSNESDIFQTVQRYGLAVLYYSTNGENWRNSTNYITDKHECEWVGVTCDNQSVLEGLNLSDNNLIGSVPHEIGVFSMLKHFDVSHNKGLKGTLPAEIQNLWSIQTLNVSNCGISGPIPNKIWLWDNLNSLIMSDNEITGSLPTETRNARRIEYIDLHNNLISGVLPKFSDETKIRDLDLSSNFFVGNLLDVGFGLQLEHLDKMNLSSNLLTGAIPSDISMSINLKTIDLSNNGLTGSIPLGLSNMKGLKTLILSGNKLNGLIPQDIYNITSLKNVLLQNNELTGTISTQIGQLIELRDISLSYNNLKGTLPNEITNLKGNLKTLHVHFNALVGRTTFMTDCNEWNDKRSFIADCGTPTVSLSPFGCKCCTICCNSDGFCRSNEDSKYTPFQSVCTICAAILGFLILCAFISKLMKKHGKLPLFKINLVKTINDDSVYCFLLTNDKICLIIAFSVIICQFLVFVSFLIASSYKTDDFLAFPKFQSTVDDWMYSKRCSPNSLECTDLQFITAYGWILFILLLIFFMGKDVVMSIKLLYTAAMARSYRLFFGGATILIVTTFAISASVFYNRAIAVSDSQLILNALLLAVFSQVDEEAMKLMKTINSTWVKKKLRDAARTSERISSRRIELHRSMIGDINQQERIDNFEIGGDDEVEGDVQENSRCCILNLFVDMIRTYTNND